MGRERNKRVLHFEPIYKKFEPVDIENTGITKLLHEEIEAIYLMDIVCLYQEDAAKSMEVSRPTFTRILKNARRKLTRGIVCGHAIEIQNSKQEYFIAVTTSDDMFSSIALDEQYIHIYHIKENTFNFLEQIDNPLHQKNLKPAIVLPNYLVEKNINCFISSKIGEGLKNSCIAKGIKPIQKRTITKDILIKLLQSNGVFSSIH